MATRGRCAGGAGIRLLAALLVTASMASCASGDGRATDRADGSVGRERSTTSTTVAAPESGATPDEVLASTRLSQMPAFANVPWADDLKEEQNRFGAQEREIGEYGIWTVPDFEGDYTNVRDNERRTRRSRCTDCPRTVVWFVGTSAAFGLGQRDEHTIASELVRLGDEDGRQLAVRNLAVPGFVQPNELDGIRKHLELDEEAPDLVVFYDGFNDVLYQYMFAAMHPDRFLTPADWGGDFIARFGEQNPPPRVAPDRIEALADHVSSMYRATQQEIRAAVAAAGAEAVFFLQADAFADPRQTEGFERILNESLRGFSDDLELPRLLELNADRLAGDVVDLRAVVPSIGAPVFADPAHMNETGARIMAEHVYDEIRPRLR